MIKNQEKKCQETSTYKLLFEIGERYVITSVLTFFAPLAFSMGGSKNTNDIFKGWVRMYCSMLLMMVMNIVFLKLIMSAMTEMDSGNVLIWLVFVVALTRVARKIDSHIGKIGLNPAQTGDGIGTRLPGMMTFMAVKAVSSAVGKSLAGGKGNAGKEGSSGRRRHTSGRSTSHRNCGSGFAGSRGSYNPSAHSTPSHTPDISGVNQNNMTQGINIGADKGGGGGLGMHSSHGVSNNRPDIKNSHVMNGEHLSSVAKGQKENSNNPINTSIAKNKKNNNSINSNTNKGDLNNTNMDSKETPRTKRPPLPRDTKGMANISNNPKSQNNNSLRENKPVTNGIDRSHRHQIDGVNIPAENGRTGMPDTAKGVMSGTVQNTTTQRSETNMPRGGNDIRVRKGNVFETNRSQENSHNVSSHQEHSQKDRPQEFIQKAVDAGYRNGRRNPAAVNKKTKYNYYQKESQTQREGINKDRAEKINRREDNGKQKR